MSEERIVYSDGPVPEPVLQEGVPEPKTWKITTFLEERVEWHFQEDQVALIRSVDSKTVQDEVLWHLELMRRRIMRPLNAAEMLQMLSNDWLSAHWQDCRGGARLLFAGTKYSCIFPDESTRDFVPSIWYDEEVRDWMLSSVAFDAPLRPGDAVACVAWEPGALITPSEPHRRLVTREQRLRPRERGRVYPLRILPTPDASA